MATYVPLLAETGEPLRVIEVTPAELPIPSSPELPMFAPEREVEEEPVEVPA